MDIKFKDKKLGKCCNSQREAFRKWGPVCGKLVMKRLDEIRDSDNLSILQTLPQVRCHPLKGDLKGIWSVDVKHPYRLLFRPANDPLPLLEDGGLDISRITAVTILRVEDTHGT